MQNPPGYDTAKAVELAFKDLAAQIKPNGLPSISPDTFVTFGLAVAAAKIPMTDYTKNTLLYYCVANSAMHKDIDDITKQGLRNVAQAMIDAGADVNYRKEPSRQYERSPSMLDLVNTYQDKEMAKILHGGKHRAHTGVYLDTHPNAPSAPPIRKGISPKDILRQVDREERENGGGPAKR
jgi:hypothetical protein